MWPAASRWGLPEREVVELQLRERFAAAKAKIPDDVVAVLGRPVAGLGAGCRGSTNNAARMRRRENGAY